VSFLETSQGHDANFNDDHGLRLYFNVIRVQHIFSLTLPSTHAKTLLRSTLRGVKVQVQVHKKLLLQRM
jgi:hypothetical protein